MIVFILLLVFYIWPLISVFMFLSFDSLLYKHY